MAPRAHQTAQARADLLAIWLDVAADDPAAADRLFDRLGARVRILKTCAKAGRLRPDIAPDARVLVERPYLILYRFVPGGVQVVRVPHGRGTSLRRCSPRGWSEQRLGSSAEDLSSGRRLG